jgi:hypothetical protein
LADEGTLGGGEVVRNDQGAVFGVEGVWPAVFLAGVETAGLEDFRRGEELVS